MIDPELLKILCCPETHQQLKPAEQPLLQKLNEQISLRTLKCCSGKLVMEKLEGGLVRADGKVLYPMRGEIPVMLIDEAIPLF